MSEEREIVEGAEDKRTIERFDCNALSQRSTQLDGSLSYTHTHTHRQTVMMESRREYAICRHVCVNSVLEGHFGEPESYSHHIGCAPPKKTNAA